MRRGDARIQVHILSGAHVGKKPTKISTHTQTIFRLSCGGRFGSTDPPKLRRRRRLHTSSRRAQCCQPASGQKGKPPRVYGDAMHADRTDKTEGTTLGAENRNFSSGRSRRPRSGVYGHKSKRLACSPDQPNKVPSIHIILCVNRRARRRRNYYYNYCYII